MLKARAVRYTNTIRAFEILDKKDGKLRESDEEVFQFGRYNRAIAYNLLLEYVRGRYPRSAKILNPGGGVMGHVLISELAMGDLKSFLQSESARTIPLSQEILFKFVENVFNAIMFMQSHLNIYHGDLHLGNVLVIPEEGETSYRALVSDFGRVEPFDHTKLLHRAQDAFDFIKEYDVAIKKLYGKSREHRYIVAATGMMVRDIQNKSEDEEFAETLNIKKIHAGWEKLYERTKKTPRLANYKALTVIEARDEQPLTVGEKPPPTERERESDDVRAKERTLAQLWW